MLLTVKHIRLFLIGGIFIVLCGFQSVQAQFEHHVLGAKPVSYGGSGLLLRNDPWAAFVNPSLYATFPGFTASATYIPGRFGLDELQSSAATLIYPFSFGSIAATVHRFGFELYSETTTSIAGGYQIGERLAVGLAVNWYHLSIDRYGSTGTAGVTAGIKAGISDRISTGLVVSNINRPTIGENRNMLPQVIRTGIVYKPHPLFNIIAEVEKDVLFDPEFRVGAEYIFSEGFSVRLGMNDRPARASGGFSVQHRTIQIDYAMQWHFELGQTHIITLQFSLGSGDDVMRKAPDVGFPEVSLPPLFNVQHMLIDTEYKPRIQDPVLESLVQFINIASVDELVELPGIGEVIARRILSFRDESGPLQFINELIDVQGIGEVTLENIIQSWRHRMHSYD